MFGKRRDGLRATGLERGRLHLVSLGQHNLVAQRRPGLNLALGRGGVAIAGHVDQTQAGFVRPFEKYQLLGPAGRMRSARQVVAAGQRIDEGGLADIGAACEGDLDGTHRWQRLDRGRGPCELPVAGEEDPALLDQLRIAINGHANISYSSWPGLSRPSTSYV